MMLNTVLGFVNTLMLEKQKEKDGKTCGCAWDPKR
jgi:hypothetical protein